MSFTALPACSGSSPRPKAILRPWKAWKPVAGSIHSLRIFSGFLAATSSISMPPSVEAIITGRSRDLSRTSPR